MGQTAHLPLVLKLVPDQALLLVLVLIVTCVHGNVAPQERLLPGAVANPVMMALTEVSAMVEAMLHRGQETVTVTMTAVGITMAEKATMAAAVVMDTTRPVLVRHLGTNRTLNHHLPDRDLRLRLRPQVIPGQVLPVLQEHQEQILTGDTLVILEDTEHHLEWSHLGYLPHLLGLDCRLHRLHRPHFPVVSTHLSNSTLEPARRHPLLPLHQPEMRRLRHPVIFLRHLLPAPKANKFLSTSLLVLTIKARVIDIFYFQYEQEKGYTNHRVICYLIY